MNKLKKVLDTINEVIDDLDILSFDKIMNKYNR